MVKERYEINELFNLIGKENLEKNDAIHKNENNQFTIEGYKCYKDSWRYRLFYQKGTKCSCCGREGVYFKPVISKENKDRIHFCLYSADNVLLTKKYVYKKENGGCDSINNFQVICKECLNKEKQEKIKNYKYRISFKQGSKNAPTYCENDLDVYRFIINQTLQFLGGGNKKTIKTKKVSDKILKNLLFYKDKIEDLSLTSFNFQNYVIERLETNGK